MWSRAQLKDKAKYALKMNYWKIILVTFLVALVVGGTASASTGASSGLTLDMSNLMNTDSSDEFEYEYDYDYNYDYDADYEYSDQYYDDENSDEYFDGYWDALFGNEMEDGESDDYYDGYNDGYIDAYVVTYDEENYSYDEEEDMEEFFEAAGIFVVVFVVLFIIFFLIILAVSYVYSAFIANPFDVGAKRFYLKSLREQAEVKEVAYAFDNSYKNVSKIMFFRMLYTGLWSLLFVIPGIVKGYEYQMIPYLLAENPELTKEQAFTISKEMMRGNKWKAFVLDLSFFGWDILASFTMGILSIFYVNPYRNLTLAALYEELSLIHGRPGVPQGELNYEYAGANPYEQANYFEQSVPPVPENFRE